MAQFICGLLLFWALSPLAQAGVRKDKAQPQTLSPFEYTSQFTVKVVNQMAGLFTGDLEVGHGTGFLIEIRKNEAGRKFGVILTNNHVVKMNINQVQRITVEFSAENNEVSEVVECEVIYRSRTLDWAALEFDLSDLKRVKNRIKPALLPKPGHILFNFAQNARRLQGLQVMAQGNPLDSQAVTTFGQISGVYNDFIQGDFIQTQTPINPGNSGGPLIEMESGYVVGINTMKAMNADNVGYAIPIGIVLEEYAQWRKDQEIAHPKFVKVRWDTLTKSDLELINAASVIEKAYPDFFNRYSSALGVNDAAPETHLRPGDVIVKAGGQLLPGRMFDMRKLIKYSHGHLDFEIVRNGQLLQIQMPVEDRYYQVLRARVDFVQVSGLVFGSLNDSELWVSARGLKNRVYLEGLLSTIETNFSGHKMPQLGSVLLSVNIDNKDYEIESLNDLKMVLKKNPESKFMRIRVLEPMGFNLNGEFQTLPNSMGGPILDTTSSTYIISLIEVVTPREFSKHKFARQFSFSPSEPETRDWRRFLRSKSSNQEPKTNCEKQLAKSS